eukprot:scaffold233409_cov15-Tisochrysis_lutea.AAC.1
MAAAEHEKPACRPSTCAVRPPIQRYRCSHLSQVRGLRAAPDVLLPTLFSLLLSCAYGLHDSWDP